jgi:glycosyltransferase involved in cell wall biosynthesis
MSADLGTRSKGTVLFLACFFPPENTSGAARPFRFYKYLPRFEYDVQVLTASSQDPTAVPGNVVCVSDQAQERRILRDYAQRLLRRLIAEDSLSWSFRSWDAAGRILSQQSFCAVLSTSSPAVSHVVAARLKSRFGIPWIADFRDPLVGNPFRKKGFSSHVDEVMEKWIFRYADALIATTDATVELWQREHPEYASKMHLIWNGFDPEDNLRAAAIPQREHKLIVHAGVLYGPRHPGALFSSLHRLIQRGLLSPQKLRVLFVGLLVKGWSEAREPAEALVRLGCLQGDGRMVPKKEAEQAIASADGLLLLDLHVEGGAVQVPAKLFDYVRIGRPILAITTRNSPVDRLLARSEVPYSSIYPEDSAEEVDRKVMLFLALPSDPVVASEWFWREFDAVAQARQLASVIGSLPKGKAHRAGLLQSSDLASGEHKAAERGVRNSELAI